MLNSILGIAGVPPIPVDVESAAGMSVDAVSADEKSTRDPLSLRLPGMTTNGKGRASGAAAGRAQAASPMRKRSWQQINRALEFESARKKEKPGNAEAGTNGLGIARIRAKN
jgi:hypothetical protein